MFIKNYILPYGDRNAITVYLPGDEHDEPVIDTPAVLFCHGWNGSKELYSLTREIAGCVDRTSCAFVTFDFFASGGTPGDMKDMTYSRWSDNILDMVEWIKKQSWHNGKIGCIAVSSGTNAAFRAEIAANPFCFLISISTCISAYMGMDSGGPGKLILENHTHLAGGGMVEFMGKQVTYDFLADATLNAPIYGLEKVKCPVLLLQGKRDNAFRRSDTYLANVMMGSVSPHLEMHELSGENHRLSNMPKKTIKIMEKFLCDIGFI